MSSFDRATYRLAGSTNEEGGLIIKKGGGGSQGAEFKKPSGSLLGLDSLARRKREQREREREREEGGGGEKRPRLAGRWDVTGGDGGERVSRRDESGARISFGRADQRVSLAMYIVLDSNMDEM